MRHCLEALRRKLKTPDDLMLRKDVVAPVADGKFSVIPVCTVDAEIQILTGVEAGQRGKDGKFPEGTVNYLVDQRLRELAEGLRGFAGSNRDRATMDQEGTGTEQNYTLRTN